jgi:hypothetical protein
MVTDGNCTVDDLNVLARKALVDRGRVARRGQAYIDRQTGRRNCSGRGDRVRLAATTRGSANPTAAPPSCAMAWKPPSPAPPADN